MRHASVAAIKLTSRRRHVPLLYIHGRRFGTAHQSISHVRTLRLNWRFISLFVSDATLCVQLPQRGVLACL